MLTLLMTEVSTVEPCHVNGKLLTTDVIVKEHLAGLIQIKNIRHRAYKMSIR